jgi:transcriptional regulator with XRE-family HTH domain
MTDMFSPGGTLRAAREKLKLTQSDIAEATRIKVHMVDSIENNDFSRIAAPLYGKGFIKLYAERVGLDPAPLIRDYLIRHSQAIRPTLNAMGVPSGVAPAQPEARPTPMSRERPRPVRPAVSAGDLLARGSEAVGRVMREVAAAGRQAAASIAAAWATRGEIGRGVMRDPRRAREFGRGMELPLGRYAAIGMAILVIAILAGFAVHLLTRELPSTQEVSIDRVVSAPSKMPAKVVAPRLRLAEEPPAPYLKPRKP